MFLGKTMWSKWIWIGLFFCGNLLYASPQRRTITIGLVDSFGPEFYIQTYSPLLDYLKEKLPQYRFKVRDQRPGKEWTFDKDDQNRFLILSSGDAVLHDQERLLQVATQKRFLQKESSHNTGALFFVKAKSPFVDLAKSRAVRIATTHPDSFDGWLIPKGELLRLGWKEPTDFHSVIFTHWSMPDVVALVNARKVDVGVLGTCEWEQLIQKGQIDPKDYRVLNEQTGADSVCRHSTSLYPGVMLAAFPTAKTRVVRDMTIALLTKPVDVNGFEWISNNQMTSVYQLLEILQRGPYRYLRDNSLSGLWRKYQNYVYLVGIGLVLLIIHVIRVNLLVRRRTKEWIRALQKKEEAARDLKKSREKLMQFERATLVTQVSGMIAHEVKQPITNTVNFLQALRILFQQGEGNTRRARMAVTKALDEAYRAAEIIDRVRAVLKNRATQQEKIDVKRLFSSALLHLKFDVSKMNWIRDRWSEEFLYVYGDRLSLELVIVNFLNNAIEAISTQRQKSIFVRGRCQGHFVVLSIQDNGPGLSRGQLRILGSWTETTKSDGLGMGLSVATSIVEEHCGHITFSSVRPHGLRVEMILPRYIERNDHANA